MGAIVPLKVGTALETSRALYLWSKLNLCNGRILSWVLCTIGTLFTLRVKFFCFLLRIRIQKAGGKTQLFFILMKCIFPEVESSCASLCKFRKKLLYALKVLPSHYWNEWTKRYPLWLCVFKTFLHHYHLLCYFPTVYHPKIQ